MTRNQLSLVCFATFSIVNGAIGFEHPPILVFSALWGMAECIRLAIQNERQHQ